MTHISIFKNFFISLLFFTGTLVSFSQGPTMDWAADSDLINADGEDVAVTSIFNKLGNTLVWDQISNTATEIKEFTITTTTGTWDEQNSIGEINYNLADTDSNASLKLIGNDDGITLWLVIYEDNLPTDTYIFRIDSLILQP